MVTAVNINSLLSRPVLVPGYAITSFKHRSKSNSELSIRVKTFKHEFNFEEAKVFHSNTLGTIFMFLKTLN